MDFKRNVNKSKRCRLISALNVTVFILSMATVCTPARSGSPSDARYEKMVPDTLDLAERGALALHVLTSIPEERFKYDTPEMCFLNVHPAWMSYTMSGRCQQKPVEAIPMLRVMSGSTKDSGIDKKVLQSVLGQIEDDGLWWISRAGRPWRNKNEADFVMTAPSGRLMNALLTWHEYDGNDQWLEVVRKMCEGWEEIVMYKDDYAYTGPVGMYYRSGGWKSEDESPFAPQFLGVLLRGVARYYAVTGDVKAGEFAEKLSRYVTKLEYWGTGEPASGEQGHARGHFHTLTFNIMGLTEYAIATNDIALKKRVKGFYEHMRDYGISRIGWFPAQSPPLDPMGQVAEPCCVADMIWLAIKLSDAGIGDYWEDVDQYVRNALAAYQFVDLDQMNAISAAGPAHGPEDPAVSTHEDDVARNLGAFGDGANLTMMFSQWTMCCVSNCSCALYYAWESIVRCTDGVAQINLLLNRASPCLDVDSYLPYEGKVVIRNKTAREMRVRIPNWVDKNAVTCRLNGEVIECDWLGNYVLISNLAKRDQVNLTFPLIESTEVHTAQSYGPYTIQMKGNTLVDISPRMEKPTGRYWPKSQQKYYQLYLRDHYKAVKAPMKKVTRDVSAPVLQW